jgi:transposase
VDTIVIALVSVIKTGSPDAYATHAASSDGQLSCHNNHLENLLRPWAMGRKAWLFAGSELAGQRAAIVMSLVQSARMNGHEPVGVFE